ncbi:cache domain-containing sensor histidine kinase [Konateibacter massiliensis]|uniref:cache domain-containing sensor histidine kinase n=1 Tax=Konateibacter massiliensis TaxID=2002841 RepID=UPI000C1565C8|nr:histidine kinase [Konateibacter massiliensis]
MKKINHLFDKLKVKYKIILSMYLIIGPLLLITTVFLYNRNTAAIEEKMIEFYKNQVSTIQENVNYLQADVLDIVTYLSINKDIRTILYQEKGSSLAENPLIWEQNAPIDLVKDNISVKNHIKTLILYTENDIRPFYVSRDSSVHNMKMEAVRQTQLFKDAYAAKGDCVWTRIDKGENSIFTKNNGGKIVVGKALYNLSKSRLVGFLCIGIDASRYEQLCSNILLDDSEGIVIVNNGVKLVQAGTVSGDMLSYAISNVILPSETVAKTKIGTNYVFSTIDETSKDQIYYIVPKEQWLSQRENAFVFPVVFFCIFFIAIWPMAMLIANIISHPLQKLNNSMMKFKEGDFEQYVEVIVDDEIGQVTECYNNMVSEIKELVDSNYVMVIRERQSELEALQAQINPHFLYNALDSLYWQAFNDDRHTLAEDIFSLSQLFRLVLNQGQSDIYVEKEAELIYHYLQIQKMRFEKRLDYKIDIDEEAKRYIIPKLILQPFVENAIVHGLECKEETGFIKITGRVDGRYLYFEVSDNGVGMTEEQINQIFDHENNDTLKYTSQRVGKFAIYNVRERLNLKYRGDFKLDIISDVGKGTTIKLCVPAQFNP